MPINYEIIPYALPPLISSFIVAGLGLFIYWKNRHSKINILFALLMAACAIWQAGFAAMNVMRLSENAFIFSRILYTGVIFIPTVYYNFVSTLFDLPKKLYARSFYFISFFFLSFLWFSHLFLSGNIRYSWGFSSTAGPLHTLYLIFFFCLFLMSFVELHKVYRIYKKLHPEKANQAKYVLAAFIVAVFASTDFLSTYGVDYYPLGFFFMILFSCITTYAITKHRLLDINIAFKRGFLYTITFSALSFGLIVAVQVVNWVSRSYFEKLSLLFIFVTTMIFSALFIPLYNYLIKSLNNAFFHATPLELASQNTKLLKEVQRQDSMKAVATLAAGMAHEIKNPLTAIKTFTEHLPKNADNQKFVDKYTKLVSSEVGKIDGIVRQVLEFSKPERLTVQKLDLRQVLNETLELLGGEFTKSNIQVEKQFDANPLIMKGDRKQLKQAFLNLLLNSIQAMPKGGQITVSGTQANGQGIQISISDTGCGISEKDLPHIFDPFYTTKESGTGLGLSIVHGIIKEHGGKIDVATNLNSGAMFRVSFQ